MNEQFLEYFGLAIGGFLFHFLKQWYTATVRNETFLNKKLLIWSLMNILAAFLLTYIGDALPPDLLVMSPITAILIGFSGSSTLSGFINVRTPRKGGKRISDDEYQTFSEDDDGDGDTGGSNPPPDKPKPPTPPGGGGNPQ